MMAMIVIQWRCSSDQFHDTQAPVLMVGVGPVFRDMNMEMWQQKWIKNFNVQVDIL